jgi:hypothetical protein
MAWRHSEGFLELELVWNEPEPPVASDAVMRALAEVATAVAGELTALREQAASTTRPLKAGPCRVSYRPAV